MLCSCDLQKKLGVEGMGGDVSSGSSGATLKGVSNSIFSDKFNAGSMRLLSVWTMHKKYKHSKDVARSSLG
jgi:hypothetical protein